MATGPDDDPQHDVLRGLAGVGESLDLVAGASGWSLSDEEARAALSQITTLTSRCRSVYLKLLADAARRDVPAADRRVGKGVETTAWLAAGHRMSAGRVRIDLREAKALDV